MTMRARVYVTLKAEVLDPQGEAVRNALTSLGVAGVRGARVGKVIDLEIDGERAEVMRALEAAAKGLLANTVIEDYRIDLEG